MHNNGDAILQSSKKNWPKIRFWICRSAVAPTDAAVKNCNIGRYGVDHSGRGGTVQNMERETDTDIYVPRSRSFGMFAEQCVDEQYYLTIFVINNSVFLSCLSVCLQLRYVNLYIKRIWMSEWIMLQLRNFFEIP